MKSGLIRKRMRMKKDLVPKKYEGMFGFDQQVG